jgi:hypothetical protein
MYNISRYEIERAEDWHSWIDKIQPFELRQGYIIKVIPPFGGALTRFLIGHTSSDRTVSIYFDGFGNLGAMDYPYYEAYEIAGETYRSADINEILVQIYLEFEPEYLIRSTYPEYFI